MSHIRGKDTKPEIIVRKFLWRHGYRYRLNHQRLPGKPDIVLKQYRTCIFVNGCFWHGHEGCKYFVMPKTRIEFWRTKISHNQERDSEVRLQLSKMGWNCITIWECDLKPDKKEATLESLLYTLSKIMLENHQQIRPYELSDEDESPLMVAEDSEINPQL